MTELDQYKAAFCEKYTPWLEKKWEDNALFHQWVNLQTFLQEPTHGLIHSATVRTTAYRIEQCYLHEEHEKIDEMVLDIMAIFHDMARHARYPSDRETIIINRQGLTKKEQHTKRFVFPHELTGAAMARITCTQDEYFGEIVDRYGTSVFSQLLRHDYHSPEVTPYTRAPQTLEAQVLCVADKTSVDPVGEVKRRYEYLTSRVNNPVFLLDLEYSIEERRHWNFEMDARDALCAIIPIFSFYPSFTSSKGLMRYYNGWSANLDVAASEVLALAERDGGKQMKTAVKNILEAFKIS